jgi:hypothetical protein
MVAVPPKWRCRAHLPDTALREGIFAHPILAQLRSNLFLKVQPGKMVYRVCSCVSETEEGR